MPNGRIETEHEFDLMAYADGLLDDDPARKALVEERLRTVPEDAARVAAYRAQNAALRRRYGWRLEDPVPERLYAALERRHRLPVRAAFRAAAVLMLTTAAGVSGWWVGQSDRSGWPPPAFLEAGHVSLSSQEASAVLQATAVGSGAAEPLNWLSDRVSLSLRMPDLTDQGYAVVGKETVHVADDRLVRLKYGRPDGSAFSLFLRPWWESGKSEIELVRQDDVWLAYWRDGPLATVLASRLPRAEVVSLARAIRRAVHDGNGAAPRVQAEPPPSGLPGMATGPGSERTPPQALPLAPVNDRPPNAGGVITTN